MKSLNILSTLLLLLSLNSCIIKEKSDWQSKPVILQRNTLCKVERWTSPDKETKELRIFNKCSNVAFYIPANIRYCQSDTDSISIKGNSQHVKWIVSSSYNTPLVIHEQDPMRFTMKSNEIEQVDVSWTSKELREIDLYSLKGGTFYASDTMRCANLEIVSMPGWDVSFDVLECDTLHTVCLSKLNIKTLICDTAITEPTGGCVNIEKIVKRLHPKTGHADSATIDSSTVNN